MNALILKGRGKIKNNNNNVLFVYTGNIIEIKNLFFKLKSRIKKMHLQIFNRYSKPFVQNVYKTILRSLFMDVCSIINVKKKEMFTLMNITCVMLLKQGTEELWNGA